MDKASNGIYQHYGADGSGYYTENGATSFIYIKDVTPIVLDALRKYALLRNVRNYISAVSWVANYEKILCNYFPFNHS